MNVQLLNKKSDFICSVIIFFAAELITKTKFKVKNFCVC